ncbi:MAG: ABC transporter ATP-binding protein [Alphaproteobacteria bacterium]
MASNMHNAGPAIRVRGLAKKFRLFDSPRDRLKEALHPFGKVYHRDFWALRDVSFDVPRGQSLGILGRNGSGKSTLLRIVASVLPPTEGTVEASGRIAALLELGAGFHPEFTGRENAALQGAIMGHSRAEIERRMPEIEAFANIGEFFDRPVKIYSSGMFLRVAFSTAINVDPDILIIDEALAVGDALFQERCYGKLADFSTAGKTTIFVSHDINAIIKHCDRAILLDAGRVVDQGDPGVIADRYVEALYNDQPLARSHATAPAPSDSGTTSLPGTEQDTASRAVEEFLAARTTDDVCAARRCYNPNERQSGNQQARIIDFLTVSNRDGPDSALVANDSLLTFYVKIWFADSIANPCQFGFALRTVDGTYVYGTNSTMRPGAFETIAAGDVTVFKFTIKASLQGGDYFVDIAAYQGSRDAVTYLAMRRRVIHFQVPRNWLFDGMADLMAQTT